MQTPTTTRVAPSSASSDEKVVLRARLTVPISETPQYLWVGAKTQILVLRHQGEIRAFNAICPHMGAEMAFDAAGGRLHCPWHGLSFDARTLNSDHHRYRRACEYRVRMEGDEIVVEGMK